MTAKACLKRKKPGFYKKPETSQHDHNEVAITFKQKTFAPYVIKHR